jgi:hypothetical protein
MSSLMPVPPDELAPFYLIISFWGKKYRDFFATLCLPSLMAPKNVPVLAQIRGSKLLIATTQADWRALEKLKLFRELHQYVEPVLIDIDLPPPGVHPGFHMSKGHAAGVERAREDKAYGMFLAPDLVLSEGTIQHLVDLAADGMQVVLAPALRFDMDKCIAAFRKRGLMGPNQPLVLPPRVASAIAAKSLHSEIQRFDWDSPFFCNYPISIYLRVPSDGLVVHTSSWAIVLGNFGMLEQIDGVSLLETTIDAHFVNDNFFRFRKTGQLHLVTDSDELIFVSMTSEADLTHYPLARSESFDKQPDFHEGIKSSDLRNFLFSDISDPFKRYAYGFSVLIHASPVSRRWDSYTRRSTSIVVNALDLPQLSKPIYFIIAVCGEKQRSELENFCLASLLSTNNIPSLAASRGCKFIVFTTKHDWNALQTCWLFVKLRWSIEVVFVKVDAAVGGTAQAESLRYAQHEGARLALKDKACAVWLNCNRMYSERTIELLIEAIDSGSAMIWATCIRVSGETFVPALESAGRFVWHRSAVLPSRTLVSLAAANLHSSFRECMWQAPFFATHPTGLICEVSGDGFLLHTADWQLLLLDFSAIELGSDSLPSDFSLEPSLDDKLGFTRRKSRGMIITDSDRFVSVSIENEPSIFSLSPSGVDLLPREFAELVKRAYLRRRVAEINGNFARSLFRTPVRFHSDGASIGWERATQEADELVREAMTVETTSGQLFRAMLMAAVTPMRWGTRVGFQTRALVRMPAVLGMRLIKRIVGSDRFQELIARNPRLKRLFKRIARLLRISFDQQQPNLTGQ